MAGYEIPRNLAASLRVVDPETAALRRASLTMNGIFFQSGKP